MLTFEIPEDLAREAVQFTETQEEAEEYVAEQLDEIHLEWPDLGSTPTTKCGGVEREGSN
jgi:hypothetical protein